MTQEQQKELKYFVSKRVEILKEIKERQYNDEWTEEFHELVIEVRQKLKQHVESLWVSPLFDILFSNTELTDEQRKLSGAIRKHINDLFKEFMNENGSGDRFRY